MWIPWLLGKIFLPMPNPLMANAAGQWEAGFSVV